MEIVQPAIAWRCDSYLVRSGPADFAFSHAFYYPLSSSSQDPQDSSQPFFSWTGLTLHTIAEKSAGNQNVASQVVLGSLIRNIDYDYINVPTGHHCRGQLIRHDVRKWPVIAQQEISELREYYRLKLLAEKQFADVLDAVKTGDSSIVLVDVRGRESFQDGHIKGAIFMPLDEIDQRYEELPRGREIVTYCYNQHCHLSVKAALKLLEHGILAKHMNVGWKEWVNAGSPIHSSQEDVGDCGGQCRANT